jgi:peptidoglycan/xylan/chitin deacetylase (PgdA/CDA1 family)
MKKLFLFLNGFLFISFSNITYSQNVSSPYEVATWLGFRKAAISYTFDDNCSNQFTKAIPIFDEFSYKLTLFTVTDSINDWEKLKSAADSGHEIANHTVSHPHISNPTLTVEQQKIELDSSTALINDKIGSKQIYTLAYPYCELWNAALCKSLFIAARGCSGSIEPKTPANMMNVSSIICGAAGNIKTEANFQTYATNAAKKSGWLVYLIHGIDNDFGYSSLSSEVLRASLQYLSTNDDKYWVSSFGNVARYIRERNSLSVEETSNQDNLITLIVSDTMDNEIFNTPVSLRRVLPGPWLSADAYQNDNLIKSDTMEENNIRYIMFDVVPDAGEIKLIQNGSTGLNHQSINNPDPKNELKVWLRNNSLVFSLPESTGNNFSVSIFDMKGTRVLNNISCKVTNGNGTVNLSGLRYLPGIYVVKVNNELSTWSKKIKL